MSITIELDGDADGSTEIDLPRKWAGIDKLYEGVGDFTVDGGQVGAVSDPAVRVVSHAPGARLTVRYRLAGRAPSEPGLNYEKARPLLRPGWFYIHGEGALATPAGRDKNPARFRWAAAPAGWRLASSLDDERDRHTVDDVVQSILIGGTDLRVIERSVDGQPLRLVVRGRWSFEDAAMADKLAAVIAAENAYMRSPAIPFLVSLVPLGGGETGATSYGGTGRTGGFALSSTTNVGLQDFLPTLAHEYGHRWFGRELGPTPEPDGPEYWFTEGFNDFVAAQSLLRAGVWQPADYAERVNGVLLRYASSPARERANADLAAHFWEDQDAQQMPYDRGHLFALSLDGERSVRATLVRMLAGEDVRPGETEGPRFLRLHGVPAARSDAMIAGRPIALPAGLFGSCGPIEAAERPIYATGYTAEEDDKGRYFAKVDEGTPAWAAGLRPGMRYVKRVSFRYGDSSVPIVMRVSEAGVERELSWLPQGRALVRFQQLRLVPEGGTACRRRLAG